jgi:phospholipid/cholesterol/gamma-HCH transport system permease protein
VPETTSNRGHGPPAQEVLRAQGDALVVRMPRGGIEPSWLARPLEELGLAGAGPVHALRVESPPEWRWGSADAAFLARVLQRLDGGGKAVGVLGLPHDLSTLLELARTKPAAREIAPADARRLVERVGALAIRHAGSLR